MKRGKWKLCRSQSTAGQRGLAASPPLAPPTRLPRPSSPHPVAVALVLSLLRALQGLPPTLQSLGIRLSPRVEATQTAGGQMGLTGSSVLSLPLPACQLPAPAPPRGHTQETAAGPGQLCQPLEYWTTLLPVGQQLLKLPKSPQLIPVFPPPTTTPHATMQTLRENPWHGSAGCRVLPITNVMAEARAFLS